MEDELGGEVSSIAHACNKVIEINCPIPAASLVLISLMEVTLQLFMVSQQLQAILD